MSQSFQKLFTFLPSINVIVATVLLLVEKKKITALFSVSESAFSSHVRKCCILKKHATEVILVG